VLERAFDAEASFTAADLALIAPVANAVASIVIAGDQCIDRHLGALDAALPSKDGGEAAGRLKLATYRTMLAGCDERALAYACRRCLEDLDWFPTVHQLKERMALWVNPDAAAISRARAITRAGRRAPDGDGDRADLTGDAVDKVNAFLATRGIGTRFAADGSTYQAADTDHQAQAA